MKNLLFLLSIVLASFSSYAQKQPQIQTESIRAPENVKIDGKLTEWADPFLQGKNEAFLSAYNPATRIYYTISNDDENLYIVMRGLGTRVARKSLEGGIVITISHAEKRKRANDPNNVYITFPVPVDLQTTANIMGPQWASFNNHLYDDFQANRKLIDSTQALSNTRLSNALKEIKVVGVKEIPDSVVSIYNTQGIKAAAQFIRMQPVYELAIPLKFLGLSVSNPVKFSYNIKLPAQNLPSGVQIESGIDIDSLYLISSTDFWGEYTLAKKQ